MVCACYVEVALAWRNIGLVHILLPMVIRPFALHFLFFPLEIFLSLTNHLCRLHVCFRRSAQDHSALVYKAAKMLTRALIDECMEEIKTRTTMPSCQSPFTGGLTALLPRIWSSSTRSHQTMPSLPLP